ncbi:hypothetical protein QJQ45_023928, partial [Haematococcus lacustris]
THAAALAKAKTQYLTWCGQPPELLPRFGQPPQMLTWLKKQFADANRKREYGSRSISRTVAAQIAELAGYESIQDSAAEILCELLVKYVTELSASSHAYAELANRSAINVHDVVLAMDDLGTSIPELQAYLSTLSSDDNTFAHALPQFPVRKPGRSMPTFKDKQEQPPPHIPDFLPAFPDRHTFVSTPQYAGHEQRPDKQAEIIQNGQRQAERALGRLHQGLMKASAARPPAAAPDDPTRTVFDAAPEVQLLPLQLASTSAGYAPTTQAGLSRAVRQQGQEQAGAGMLSAFEPDAAVRAFAAVLPSGSVLPAAGAGNEHAEAGSRQGAGALVIEAGDLFGPEELSWRSAVHMDSSGVLKQPLGATHDFATATFAAAAVYASGRPAEDAYKTAATASVAGGGGSGYARKRKSTYGSLSLDPAKKKAEDILERSAHPGEGEEQQA